MKKIIIILIAIFAISSCKIEEKVYKVEIANWVLGKWEVKSNDGVLSETWEKTNDSVFNGHAFFIKAKDTLHNENIVLKQKGDDLLYIPTVKGQNNDQPITFKLTNSSTNQLVFENPKHDYPQKIIYNLITKDSLSTTISGILQGKPSIESYGMKKK